MKKQITFEYRRLKDEIYADSSKCTFLKYLEHCAAILEQEAGDMKLTP